MAFDFLHQPDMEASALRALDLEDDVRLPCLFHADDPIFPGSSRGALQHTLDVVAAWARSVGAAFHVGPRKTVCMNSGLLGIGAGTVKYEGTELVKVSSHRYLGILCPCDLDFTAFLKQRLGFACAELAQLAGFAASGSLPWLRICELFDTKVDSILDFGRWLFIMVPGAQELLDEFYDRASRLLLGADFWRNPGTCSSELAWQTSGYGRVVRSVALRRAKLWQTCESNWHALFFRMSACVDGSWSKTSEAILGKYSIMDWLV